MVCLYLSTDKCTLTESRDVDTSKAGESIIIYCFLSNFLFYSIL